MKNNTNIRRSIRLKNYDYSQDGYYFITICVQNRAFMFGEIENGKIILTDIGILAKQHWMDIPNHYNNILLDEYIIMPNHIHGIIGINNTENICRGVALQRTMIQERSMIQMQPTSIHKQPISKVVASNDPTIKNEYMSSISPKQGTLSAIIRSYKSGVTKQLHNDGFIGPIWQSKYYDHIIRNEVELNKIREYIVNNPANLEYDELYIK